MPSTPTSVLAALAVVGTLAGVGAATAGPQTQPASRTVAVETAPDDAAPTASVDTVSIECGGYDADGNVVTEAATRIDRAPVDSAGIPLIPAVCGGYTADGTFIGDD